MFEIYIVQLINLYNENPKIFKNILCGLTFVILYILYLKKFKYYVYREENHHPLLKRNFQRGQPPPSFPNGWFRVLSSWELKKGEISALKLNGRRLALFRGEDGKAYCVDAFCPHMGANLAEGGHVKWKQCIECPFHGWTFDGATGLGVNSENLDPKKVSVHEYNNPVEMAKVNGKFIKTEQENHVTNVKKYAVKEVNDIVWVWFHAKDKEPFYQIPDMTKFNFFCTTMQARCETWEFINCHVQEIPENGADWKHFEYVHFYLFEFLVPWLKFAWRPLSRRGNSPDFYEAMTKHERKPVREFQKKLYAAILHDEKQNQYINVISLDSYFRFFDKYNVYLLTATVFQIGSASVYLFFKFPMWETMLIQTLVPCYKFCQQVCHKFYTVWWLPYWFTTLLLRVYMKQVGADKRIWNNKVFFQKINYNLKSEADQALFSWREWYANYYEGCGEMEKSLNQYDW